MTEQKFDPVKEFINLRDNISKTIGQSIRNVTGATGEFPAVDIYETETTVIVYTEPLLGVVAASIEVDMEENNLTIRGETRSKRNIPEADFIRRELTFGTFSRTIAIPRVVNPNAAAASLKQGVLTVTLPKVSQVADQIIAITPTE